MKKYFKKQYKLLLCTFVLCLIYSILNVGIAVLLQHIVDIATSKNIEKFLKLMSIATIYIFLLTGVYYIYCRTINKLSNSIVADLRSDLFSNILQKNYEEFVSNDSTVYISSLVNDINLLESNYIGPCIRIIQNSIVFILTALLLFNYGGIIIIWLTFILLLMMVTPKILGSIMQDRQNRLSNELKTFTQIIRDYFSGYEAIRTANIENIIIQKFENENKVVYLRKYNRDNIISTSDSVSCLLSSFMQLSIIFIGVFSIIRGNMTIGVLTALVQLCNMFTTPVSSIMQDLSEIKSSKLVMKKIVALIENTEEKGIYDIETIKYINIKNVKFKYPSKNEMVLEINGLQIEQGKKYLVIGKSGCGKSTLLKLLAGYFKKYEGDILYNGIELRNINSKTIYKKIAIIHQNIFLFNASIIDNITMGQKYSEQEIEAVLQISGIDLFINSIPKGLDARVGENGRELSGGQRQRIAIARALIQKKEILIIDEGLSSIDKQTGYDIENRILAIPNITIINVSHEIIETSLNKYDEVIFIYDGGILEKGSYNKLISESDEFQKYITLQNN